MPLPIQLVYESHSHRGFSPVVTEALMPFNRFNGNYILGSTFRE